MRRRRVTGCSSSSRRGGWWCRVRCPRSGRRRGGRCPSPTGSVSRQASRPSSTSGPIGQRGWKRQPDGGWCGSAGSASAMAAGSAAIAAPDRGAEASNSCVYACCGSPSTSSARPELHDPAEVHDRDVVAHVPHDREVVRDEQHRQAQLALQVADEVQHCALDRDVQRRGDLVGDDARPAGPRGRGRLRRAGAGRRRAAPGYCAARSGASSTSSSSRTTSARRPAGPAARSRGMASAIEAPIVIRGSSDEYGSWNTICTRRRAPARCDRPSG